MTTQRDFWKNLKSYDFEQYSKVPLSKLTTVGISKLNDSNIEASYDNITVILFKLFPEKFSLINFPEYPDTLRVNRALTSHCLTAGYIAGNQKTNIYSLTGIGRKIADEFFENVDSTSHSKSKTSDLKRSKYIRLVKSVTDSSGYKKWSEKDFKNFKKFDLCESLHCTIDADESHLRSNLDTLVHYANNTKKFQNFEKLSNSVLEYLEFVKSNIGTYVK
tara:strand:+ start:135 stop:791 length:657 start_codon:yes stop_codon:yes gene_type:complete